MHKKIGLIAGGAAVALAAVAGCTSASTTSSGPSGNGGGAAVANLSPVAFIKSALTKTSDYKSVHMTGTVGSAQSNATMVADEQFSPEVAMSMTVNSSMLNMSEVLVGDTIYVKVPQVAAELGGKAWAKIDLSEMGSLGSGIGSMLDSAKSMDPSQQLQVLLASGNLHQVGTETVDGVRTVHYAGTVKPADFVNNEAAAKNLTQAQAAQVKSLLKDVTGADTDVWVSTDGLLVREKSTVETSAGTVNTDLHLSDWGKPVSVSAPPADQVGDLSSMLNNLGGSGSGN
jgi:hypothetical protein